MRDVMNVSVLLMLSGALLLSACHEATQPDGDRTASQALEGGPPVSADTAEANRIERAEKAAWVEGAPVVQPVDWVAADAHPALDTSLLKPDAVKKLARVPVPVLLPNDATLLQDVFVSTGEHWYSARLRAEGLTVVIKGTAAAFRHGIELTPAEKARLQQFQVSRSHQIVTLAATFFGVAYSVDVECKAPMTDARCTEDAFVLKLAESLERAGGAQ